MLHNYVLQEDGIHNKAAIGKNKRRSEEGVSIVIIGGHDRMVCKYKKICKDYSCKAKVFTQMSGNLKEKLGSPDLFVLFTNTVSHKMVRCALVEAEKNDVEVIRSHSSSGSALIEILEEKCSIKK